MENSNKLAPEKISIIETTKVINAKYSRLDGSTFVILKTSNASFNDADLSSRKITNANLSDLEIEGAQPGGAYIHHIGMPPEGILPMTRRLSYVPCALMIAICAGAPLPTATWKALPLMIVILKG
jgi:hypothetical protein